MLSRTADNMFWLARYVERAENLSRLLDVSFRLSLMGLGENDDGLQAWRLGLEIADDDAMFAARYGQVTPEAVLTYLALDTDNPASIVTSIQKARENARVLRNHITQEMWEAINDTWIGLERFDRNATRLGDGGTTVFLEWVRERSHLFRGVTYGTMLHDDAFWFGRIGTFVERADNTARLLKFKTQALARHTAKQDATEFEYYQWASLLRSLGAFRAYHRSYRDRIQPDRVVELLLLSPAMPRSLRHCIDHVMDSLDRLGAPQDADVRRQAAALAADLENARVPAILRTGIEAFLDDHMDRNAAISEALHRHYMDLR
ncbi:alpha-E domain-containing protein [Marinivivus vitaminiproducens]|uniref:alpha-E domain-containing protein n=1 Tax=Marinivivus vitaminiproducens TaxID=3035935 RepID=UPI0027A86553|nr:alpha-E domain-containing protein [Geminicoccaceae bacterium SCSIO 64248]